MARKKAKKDAMPAGPAKGGKAGKKGSDGKAAKTSKPPKQIAGVKLPKSLREPAAKLLKAVQHPVVVDVAAAALIAAAGALRDNKAPPPGTGRSKVNAASLGAIIANTAIDAVRKAATESGGGGASAGRSGETGKKSARPDPGLAL